MQLDERFRCELTSLVWLLSLATAGNLLAISSDQTLVYARSLVKVCVFVLSTSISGLHCPCTLPGLPDEASNTAQSTAHQAGLMRPLLYLPADVAHSGDAAGS